MAINCYTGLMGSGKTYEVVSSVIVAAVCAGRRVVTNIDGIDNDAIKAYCCEKKGVPLEKCGEVWKVSDDAVKSRNFFPFEKKVITDSNGEFVTLYTDNGTFVQCGDLVCIDEAWKFWGTGTKVLPEHAVFFREHRHFVHRDTNVSCDLVLMVQDIGDLVRTLKVVVEMTFRTEKCKSLGLNKRYSVRQWEGWKAKKGPVVNKTYDPEIFPLYSSYSGGVGKEIVVDGRQNILKRPFFLLSFVVSLVAIGYSIYFLLGFFHPKKAAPVAASASVAVAPVAAGAAAPSVSPAGGVPPGGFAKAAGSGGGAGASGGRYSTEWRIVGVVRRDGKVFVAVKSADMPLRLEPAGGFLFVDGRPVSGEIDGQRVTGFSGSAAPVGSSSAAGLSAGGGVAKALGGMR